MLKRYSLLILLLWSTLSYAVTLTESQEQEKQQGIAYFSQRYNKKSQPLLEPAAKAGDAEAQYYLAEAMRQDNFSTITQEAYHWFEQAAKQGELYAMIQLARSHNYCDLFKSCTLTPKEWREKANQTILAKANQGDSEAMGLMYELTGKVSWLEEAANAGNPYYQNRLAQRNADKIPNFVNSPAYNKLIEESAKGGYVPAMYNYGYILAEQGNLEEGQSWVLKAVNAGNLRTTKIYAITILSDKYNKEDSFKFPMDRVKGYGLLSLVAANGGADGNTAKFFMEEAEKQMTPEQINQAKQYAEEWKKTHPPLSYFYPKLGLL